MTGSAKPCCFCQIARSATSTPLLYTDDQVISFPDINPSAYRHYLVIPKAHIPTVKNLRRMAEDYQLVFHMLDVGRSLLQKDAPESKLYRFSICALLFMFLLPTLRFGFHQPPFNSVNHLHLHCFALPFIPRWKHLKYLSMGPLGGFLEADKLLERIRPF